MTHHFFPAEDNEREDAPVLEKQVKAGVKVNTTSRLKTMKTE